jgi:hypothetical protein
MILLIVLCGYDALVLDRIGKLKLRVLGSRSGKEEIRT